MNSYWKSFKVEELFKRSTKHKIKTPLKELEIRQTKDKKFKIANVMSSACNNGINGYLEDTGEITNKKHKGFLTIASKCNSGATFYQDDWFVSSSDNNIILIKDTNLKNILDKNKFIYSYLAKLCHIIYCNKQHGWEPGAPSQKDGRARTIMTGNDFNREIILLPVRTCLENEEEIWTEDDGTKITLDVDKIQEIIERVKNHKKEKIIRKYEAEKVKYELEKSKYELEKVKYDKDEEFIEKYKKIYWKSYKQKDLFERDNRHVIKSALKDLKTSNEKNKKFTIANVTGSEVNNSIANYLEDSGEITTKKQKNGLTLAYLGKANYQSSEFVSTGHNNFIDIKDKTFEANLNFYSYKYLSNCLTINMKTKFRTFTRDCSGGKGNDFNREIILLPVIQDNQGNEEIFTDAMAYLYLKSMILKQDKKIQNYNNKIKELKGE